MNFSKFTIYIATILLLSTLLTPSIHADQSRLSRADYIARYRHIAIKHQQEFGIPASITMAQGILESDSGNSILARGSNNHFGIKCKSHWRGRTYYYTDDAPDECFRAYDSVEESYEDHALFLESSPRYDSLFAFSPTDYRSWARALKGAGYATAPDYTQKLIKLIEDNKLHKLDQIAAGTTPIVVAQQTQSTQIDPNNNRIGRNTHMGRKLYQTDRSTYIIVKEGDDLNRIAQEFDLSKAKLRRMNGLKKDDLIAPSDTLHINVK